MRFAFEVVAGNVLLLAIGVGAVAVVVGALIWSAVVGEIRELFETPEEKEQD